MPSVSLVLFIFGGRNQYRRRENGPPGTKVITPLPDDDENKVIKALLDGMIINRFCNPVDGDLTNATLEERRDGHHRQPPR